MRIHLLTTTAALALLAAMPARAQNATWLPNPGSGDFNTAANWTPATVPTGTAFFDASNTTALTFSSGFTTVGGFTFNAGAPSYSFSLTSPNVLAFNGAGITNNSASGVQFATSFGTVLAFTNNSTAGTAATQIINNGGLAVTVFANSSTAGSATIVNVNNGSVNFNDTSTAGSATITSSANGFADFVGSSNAGTATIITNAIGFTTFRDNSSAGNAVLANNDGGNLRFFGASTAGNATIITNLGGTTSFSQFSTGGNAAFTTRAGGVFDMSALIAPGMTAGSIEGQGTYFLGSKTLTVGGNNLSTTVEGTISDGGAASGTGGSLVKTGTRAMTLSGANP